MDIATLITLLLEKKKELLQQLTDLLTRHFQKIAPHEEDNVEDAASSENEGISAVVGSIAQNLADLQDDQRRYVSIYDQPTLCLSVFINNVLILYFYLAIRINAVFYEFIVDPFGSYAFLIPQLGYVNGHLGVDNALIDEIIRIP
ncbi:hypothetical protein Tco_0750775 [Tanacetum coccineum]|uniref:Uncharacterized protein n=1 Tax=Tanacetum coccineum TaxID=301880 RepID=A0ABQ4Z260_9ASTR